MLVLAAAVGFVGLLLRQPLILSFIAVGILAEPSVPDIARSDEQIDLLAELGIAVLLFLVGLKLDLNLIQTLGPVALLTGLGQILFTTVFGFLIALGLGLSIVAGLYVAIALTFSSTIIIVKLLSDMPVCKVSSRSMAMPSIRNFSVICLWPACAGPHRRFRNWPPALRMMIRVWR